MVSAVTNTFSVPGFKLGHWEDPDGRTGCTVVIADELVPAAVDVRGGAPGTRETDLLGAGKSVQRLDAVLLTGGSAFGLAAADGVVNWLFEHGRGFPTAVMPVPIVAGAVIFDLAGDEPAWPTSHEGYIAASSAAEEWIGGNVGGGAGASVSKALGRQHARASGTGIAQISTPAGTVSAVFINNAFADVFDPELCRYLTTPGNLPQSTEDILLNRSLETDSGINTVIGAIAISRPLDHNALTRITVAGQAGIARTIRPAHTPVDGDTVFALATGDGTCSAQELMQLTTAAQAAVSRALIAAVT